MKWHIYYVINEIRIYIMEFQYMMDAYSWLKKHCSTKADGCYFNDLRVYCEYH